MTRLQDTQVKELKFQLIYIIIAFAGVHLNSFLFDMTRGLGFSLEKSSLVLSVFTIGNGLGQLVLGYVSDKLQKIKFVIVCSLGVSLLSAVLNIFFQNQFLYLSVFLLGFFLISLYTLIDTWVLNDKDVGRNFSKILIASPIGRGIASTLLGFVFATFGYGIFHYTLSIFIILTIFAYRFVDEKKQSSAAKRVTFSDVRALFLSKGYRNTILMLFLTYLGIGTVTIFSIALIRNLGGTSFHIGLFSTISGVFEILLLYLFNRFSNKLKPQAFLVIVCSGIIVHLLFLIFAKSYVIILISAVFNAVSFISFLVGSKYLVNAVTPMAVINTGQAIGATVFYNISFALNSSFSGFLAERIGITACLKVYLYFVIFLLVVHINNYRRQANAKTYLSVKT